MLSMPVHLPESQEKSRNSDRWAASKAERVALVESAFSCGVNIEPFAKNKTIEVFDVRDRYEISVSSYGAIRTNCIVPFSVERVGTNIYLCDLLF
jgi:hypothetical protein